MIKKGHCVVRRMIYGILPINIYHKWNISKNIYKRKKINSTFQHKFSTLHGSIIDRLLNIYMYHDCSLHVGKKLKQRKIMGNLTILFCFLSRALQKKVHKGFKFSHGSFLTEKRIQIFWAQKFKNISLI